MLFYLCCFFCMNGRRRVFLDLINNIECSSRAKNLDGSKKLTSVSRFTSAPLSTKYLTTARWFSWAAMYSGVKALSGVTEFTAAPLDTNSWTSGKWPERDAMCRAVFPFWNEENILKTRHDEGICRTIIWHTNLNWNLQISPFKAMLKHWRRFGDARGTQVLYQNGSSYYYYHESYIALWV